jgi:hypothetical protein
MFKGAEPNLRFNLILRGKNFLTGLQSLHRFIDQLLFNRQTLISFEADSKLFFLPSLQRESSRKIC